jgi:hypothetical protein
VIFLNTDRGGGLQAVCNMHSCAGLSALGIYNADRVCTSGNEGKATAILHPVLQHATISRKACGIAHECDTQYERAGRPTFTFLRIPNQVHSESRYDSSVDC